MKFLKSIIYHPLSPAFKFRFFVLLLFFIAFIISIKDINAQCGSFRTQTQEEWGALPKGNNTAAYLYRRFNTVFPNGLTVGCAHQIVLSSPEAITEFLPTNGTASALPNGTITNPMSPLNNTLLGQVIALKLNLAFDAADGNFSSGETPLKNLIIKNGVFSGKTPEMVLSEAEKAIGGCVSAATLSDLTNVITKINENFDNGTVDNGLLNCVSQNACLNDKEAPIFKETPLTFTVFVKDCYVASWNLPIVTDNCSAVTLTSNIALGECLPIGIHRVVMTAKDASGNTSTYSFTVTIESALYLEPIKPSIRKTELVSFMSQNTIKLNWINKVNEDTEYFIVQKGNDLELFEDIETISARAFSGEQAYSFTDKKLDKDYATYRIKTVLKNRTVQYSESQTLDLKNKDLIVVYPSPNDEMVNIDLTKINNQAVRIILSDLAGQVVYNTYISQATQPAQINISSFPEGQYLLSVLTQSNDSFTKTLFIEN